MKSDQTRFSAAAAPSQQTQQLILLTDIFPGTGILSSWNLDKVCSGEHEWN